MQSTHDVAPYLFWYVPLGHWLQLRDPALAAKYPGRQVSQEAAPGIELVPAGHARQPALRVLSL